MASAASGSHAHVIGMVREGTMASDPGRRRSFAPSVFGCGSKRCSNLQSLCAMRGRVIVTGALERASAAFTPMAQWLMGAARSFRACVAVAMQVRADYCALERALVLGASPPS